MSAKANSLRHCQRNPTFAHHRDLACPFCVTYPIPDLSPAELKRRRKLADEHNFGTKDTP